jgi:hypothetical protein
MQSTPLPFNDLAVRTDAIAHMAPRMDTSFHRAAVQFIDTQTKEHQQQQHPYLTASMRWRARYLLADRLGPTDEAIHLLEEAIDLLLPFHTTPHIHVVVVDASTFPPAVVPALRFHVPKDVDGGVVDALLRHLTDTATALCSACVALRRYADAERHAADAITFSTTLLSSSNDDPDLEEERSHPAFHALCAAAHVHVRQHRHDAAVERYQAAVELATRYHGTVHPLVQEGLDCVATTYLDAGDYVAAAHWAQTSYDALVSSEEDDKEDNDRALGRAAFLLAEACWRSDGAAVDPAHGEACARQALAAQARWAPSTKDVAAVAHLHCLSEVLQLRGDLGDEPQRLLERAVNIVSWHRSRGAADVADACTSLVVLLDALAKFHERRSVRIADAAVRAEACKLSKLYYEQALLARK